MDQSISMNLYIGPQCKLEKLYITIRRDFASEDLGQ